MIRATGSIVKKEPRKEEKEQKVELLLLQTTNF
jgi:hypothetical protein